MTVEVLLGGLLKSFYLVPIAVGFALASRHGGYLTLWLPQCGAIAAYFARWLVVSIGVTSAVGVSLATVGSVALALVFHRLFFHRHVIDQDPYPALLKGIALIVLVESVIGLFTRGYALSLAALQPEWSAFVGWPVNNTIRLHDLVAIANGVLVPAVLAISITRTRTGLAYRAVASDRQLATQYGMPTVRIDVLVICLAASLCAVGGVAYGLEYALTPQMMTGPSLKVVAVVVAFAPQRVVWIAIGVLAMGMVESVFQSLHTLSVFEHAVSFLLLVVALLARHLLIPTWERRAGGSAVRGLGPG